MLGLGLGLGLGLVLMFSRRRPSICFVVCLFKSGEARESRHDLSLDALLRMSESCVLVGAFVGVGIQCSVYVVGR